MTDEEKQQIIETMPAGVELHFPGHTMLYLGTVDGVSYAISALGTVVESEGATDVLTVYNVTVTPLTVRRGKYRPSCSKNVFFGTSRGVCCFFIDSGKKIW